MRRRTFLSLVAGAAAWPVVAHAQKAARQYRIFWMSTDSQPDPFLDGFREGLQKQGYVEGRNLALELYYAPGNYAGLRPVVSELGRWAVDLIVSSGPASRALRDVTTVPVLFAVSGDPIELGLVNSLAHPGGNSTGSTFLSLDLAGKRVELLKEMFPKLRKLAVLSNADHPGERSEWHATRRIADTLGIQPLYFPFRGIHEMDNALAAISDAAAEALLVFPDALTMVHRSKLAEFSLQQRLPSMFGWSEYCEAGGLMGYGANQRATYFGLATYADKILRGEKPANLPVQQPTRFELTVNVKVARALGIEADVSPLLFRANKVIE